MKQRIVRTKKFPIYEESIEKPRKERNVAGS